GALVVVWYGSHAVISGRISVGQFVAFNGYLAMLGWPMIAFGWVTNMIQRGMASWKRMLQVLETEPAIADSVGGPAGPRTHALRGAIGFVPQEPFLFSDSLAANVAFGFDAQDARGAALSGPPGDRQQSILDAAAVSRLDKDVADFPNGYDTMVGERGITLSGGQKQRTALARAVVIDPRILILDDALSAVDTYTEEEILSRLREVMRQRTSIIVSHRISTVREADIIFVLDEGRIVERGTHAELVRGGGLYATLHNKQLLEEELPA